MFKGANLSRLDFNIGYLDPKNPPLYNRDIFLFVDSIGLCLYLLASFAFNRNIPSPKTSAEILVWQNLSVARTKKCVPTPTFQTGNSSPELRPLRARRRAPIFCDRCSHSVRNVNDASHWFSSFLAAWASCTFIELTTPTQEMRKSHPLDVGNKIPWQLPGQKWHQFWCTTGLFLGPEDGDFI